MRAPRFALVAVLGLSACGGSPTSPTPSTPTTPHWSLSGTVKSATGDALSGATIAILDGPDAGRTAISSSTGAYTVDGLTQAGFSVRASIAGYTPQTVGVTLTANVTTNFTLQRIPTADLTSAGSLIFALAGPNSYTVSAVIINQGDGCATEIAGDVTIRKADGTIATTLHFALAPTVVIRPGEQLTAPIAELTVDQVAALGPNGTFGVAFTFKTGGC